jgi:hypothetical protein
VKKTPPGSRVPVQLVSPEPEKDRIRRTVFDRTELIVTGVMDSLFVASMVVARGLLLRLFDWMLPVGRSETILLRVLEIVLDIGLVGAALAVTVFDLAKRVRNAIADYRNPVG